MATQTQAPEEHPREQGATADSASPTSSAGLGIHPRWLLAGILLPTIAAFAIRVARLLQTPNLYSSDPATRALFAEKLTIFGWAEVYRSTVWPPVHFWLLSWGQNFPWTDPQVGARGVGVVLGALTCWPAFLVVHRSARLLWPKAETSAVVAGALSATLLALTPLSLRFATLTYAEVPCTFFVLAACAALLPDEKGRPARWWRALLCLAMACGLRYEAWLLAPLLLLCSSLRLRDRMFLATAAVVPSSLWVINRPKFLALNSVTRDKMADIVPSLAPERTDAILGIFRALLENTLPLLLPLSLLGLFLLVRKRETLCLPAATALTLAFPPISALLGHVPLFERYLQMPVALLSTTAAIGTVGCGQLLKSSRIQWALAPTAVVTVLVGLLVVPMAVQTPAGIKEVLAEGDPPLHWQPASNEDALLWRSQTLATQAWHTLDETAQLLRAVRAQHPDLMVYIEPNLRTASYLYWRASIPPDRIAHLYRSSAHDPEWREDLNKVRLGWPRALFVLVKEGGESVFALSLPGPEVPCREIQGHRVGDSRLSCLGETASYRVLDITPVLPAERASHNE